MSRRRRGRRRGEEGMPFKYSQLSAVRPTYNLRDHNLRDLGGTSVPATPIAVPVAADA